MPVQTALLGVIPPLLVAAAVLLVALRPWRRGAGTARDGPGAAWSTAWGAAAVAAAYAATDALVHRSPPGLPPADAHRWLPAVALAAAVGAALGIGRRGGRWAAAPVAALGAVCLWPVAAAARPGGSGLGTPWTTVVPWALAAAVVERALALGARAGGGRRAGAGAVAGVMMLAAVGAAVTCVQSWWSSGAQMAGALAVAAGAVGAVAAWRPGAGTDALRGAATVFAVVLTGLVLAGPLTPASRALLLAGAAAGAGVQAIPARGAAARIMRTMAAAAATGGLGMLAAWRSPMGLDFGGM